MFEDAELWFDDKDATIASTATTTDGDHGRIEVRTCRVTMDIAWFQAMHAWPELACIAEVVNQTTVKRTGKTTLEKRLFLCSRCAPAASSWKPAACTGTSRTRFITSWTLHSARISAGPAATTRKPTLLFFGALR